MDPDRRSHLISFIAGTLWIVGKNKGGIIMMIDGVLALIAAGIVGFFFGLYCW